MWARLRSWFSRQFFNITHSSGLWSRCPTSRHVGNDARSHGNARSGGTPLVRARERRNKMTFKLSNRSLGKLEGVHPLLVKVVETAIQHTQTDFGVIFGVRTLAEQQELFDKGASKTMNSNHLIQDDGYSHAVDLMAYVGSRGSWELSLYDDLADAMKIAAEEHGAHIRWGGSWTVDDIRTWDGTMEEAMNSYVDLRRSQGRRPFIDGPHFELRSLA